MGSKVEEGVGEKRIKSIPPSEFANVALGINLRQDVDGIEALALDIARNGQIQPGVVRRNAQGKLEVVAGFRRFAALKYIAANPDKFPVEEFPLTKQPIPFLAMFQNLTEEEGLLINIAENKARKDLSPMDLAYAASQLQKLEWTNKRISDLLGISPVKVGKVTQLVTLPKKIRKLVHAGPKKGGITESAAHALIGLEKEEIEQAVEDLTSKKVKAVDLVAKKKDKKRASGGKDKVQARTMKELREMLESLPDSRGACDLLAWIKGELKDLPAGTFAV